MKEMLKALCDMNNALYESGCIRAGGGEKEIHLTNKAFRSLFNECRNEWHIEPHDDEYECITVYADGYNFFTLMKF